MLLWLLEIPFRMGKDQFYVYRGNVNQLNCTVREKVLTDINNEQLQKYSLGLIQAFKKYGGFTLH